MSGLHLRLMCNPAASKPCRLPDRKHLDILANNHVASREVEGVNLDSDPVIVADVPIAGIDIAPAFARKDRKLSLKEVCHFAAVIDTALSPSRGAHAVDGTHLVGIVLQRLAELQKKPGVALRVPGPGDPHAGKQFLDRPPKRNPLADLMPLTIGSFPVTRVTPKAKPP